MKTKVTELTVSRSCSRPPPQKTEALEKTCGLSQVLKTSARHLPVNFVVLRVMNGFVREDELTAPPPSDQWVRRPAQSGSVLLSAGIYKKWSDICHGCKKKKKKCCPRQKTRRAGTAEQTPESHMSPWAAGDFCAPHVGDAAPPPLNTQPAISPPTHRHNNTEVLQVVCLELWWQSLVNSQSIRHVVFVFFFTSAARLWSKYSINMSSVSCLI